MSKVLKGGVRYNEKYRWNAEDDACDECKELDGKVFESAEEIPQKPHPNCKCHIEVIENQTNDPIGRYRAEIFEKQKAEQEIKKITGDINSIKEEIDAAISSANEQNSEIDEFIQTQNDIPHVVLQKFTTEKQDIKKNIETAKDLKNKASSIEKEIKIVEMKEISGLKLEVKVLSDKVDNVTKEIFDRGLQLTGSLLQLRESLSLWNLSFSKFTEARDYIEKNGEFYESIDNIEEENLRNFVKNKVKKQFQEKDSRGVIFNENSSLAEKINTSFALKKLIKNKKSELLPGASLPDTSLSFSVWNFDLYNAIHRADIVDIHVDLNGDFTAKVIDTYDFNPHSWNPAVMAAGHFQKERKIENYFVVVKIKIPRETWIKY